MASVFHVKKQSEEKDDDHSFFTFTETELNRSACIGKLDCFRASAGTPPAS